jgi:hypothetical protein
MTITFDEALIKFSQRLKMEPLAKSVKPTDYKGIVRALDPNGASVVDYGRQLTAHPPSHQPKVDLYNSIVDPATPVFKRHPLKIEGVTRKIVYAVPDKLSPATTHKFLVKPYHEHITKPARFWMQHPIQGWAELTNQALFHAAGIGHLHQTSHVAPHDMGPGHETEPAVVIAMHPAAKLLTKMHPREDPSGREALTHWKPSMFYDALKIGAMDFLGHNMDRHEHNLMYIPGDHLDKGMPPLSYLLAIDHGRNFQYKAAMKGIHMYVLDNGVKRRLEPHERPDPLIDNLSNYVFSHGNAFIRRVGKALGYPPPTGPEMMNYISQWWPSIADNVTEEFKHHLQAIKNPKIREHLLKNFMDRAQLLTRISTDPNSISGPRDLEIPIHRFKR